MSGNIHHFLQTADYSILFSFQYQKALNTHNSVFRIINFLNMFDEIGGNFWLKPRQQTDSIHFNLNIKHITEYEHVIYTSSGRSAITLLLKHIKQTNNTVLVPSYTCESVILPLINNKCNIHFYDINVDLSIDENSFFNLLINYSQELFMSNHILDLIHLLI